jgi:dihydropyrimidinase
MSTSIRNGTIITAVDRYTADIFVENETITLIGKDLSVQADNTIDATGKLIFPGGVDVHTHLDMPLGSIHSSDNFETGTIAAAFGGTTCIIDYATQMRGEMIQTAFETWMKKAERKSVIDYGFHMAITDASEDTLAGMKEMIREGITSFKVYMAYPDSLMLDDGTILRLLTWCVEHGALICAHAENGSVVQELVKKALSDGKTAPRYHSLTRPARTEGEATARAIALAQMAGAPIYIVHLSCSEALEKVKVAHDMGLPIYVETCPQYLLLSAEEYERPGFEGAKFVISPPLRERWNQEVLWEGLAGGDIHTVATDHCPFVMKEGYKGLPKQKELGLSDFTKIPNGAPGIETRFALTYTGGVLARKIDVHRFVDAISTRPAKIFGLFPRKGTIAVGSDADIVIFDPDREITISAETHHMRVDYNPYEGMKLKGMPSTVLSRGRVIVDKGKFVGEAGRGKFIKRSTLK